MLTVKIMGRDIKVSFRYGVCDDNGIPLSGQSLLLDHEIVVNTIDTEPVETFFHEYFHFFNYYCGWARSTSTGRGLKRTRISVASIACASRGHHGLARTRFELHIQPKPADCCDRAVKAV